MRQIGDRAPLSRGKKNGYIVKKHGWSYHTPTLSQSSPHTQIHWNLRLWYLQWHPLPQQSQSIPLLWLTHWLSSKESTWSHRRCGFDLWVGKIPWRRACQPLSSTRAQKIQWTEEPDGLQFTGPQRVRHRCSDLAHMHAYRAYAFPYRRPFRVLTFYLMRPLHSHTLGKGEAVNALSSLPVTNYSKSRGKAG